MSRYTEYGEVNRKPSYTKGKLILHTHNEEYACSVFRVWICKRCGDEFESVGRLHWHLRIQHHYKAQEAYDSAGTSAVDFSV